MEEGLLSNALMLMLIGMGSVFVILILVVVIVNTLVAVINRYFPAKVVEKAAPILKIDDKKLAIISSTVEMITKGSGRVKSVKKIN